MPKIWTSYNSPLIAILASSIFILFERYNGYESNIIWKIDRLCFGVYLIHPLFIQFVYRFLKIIPVNFNTYPIITIMMFTFFTICAFLSSFIMRLIKPLKNYVL